ncbi:carbamoyl-phosphate synthase small chain [Clostridia bacterium]|nr:carbamoyl-phosphate synthase small chain [Clostridia bacterium]
MKACLLLENGDIFEGKSFGAVGSVSGEIVFTTAMTGYQETLTDPSYCGQIVTQTFPLIGNYGTNDRDYESAGSVVAGYIVREHCDRPSNFRSTESIDGFLKRFGIVGLYGADTRSLTRVIREAGVMNGLITTEPISLGAGSADTVAEISKLKSLKVSGCVPKVSVTAEQVFDAGGKYNVVMFDYGHKKNILRKLLDFSCNITVVPWDTPAERVIELNPDGIMLSNGPGDPQENVTSIEALRKLTNTGIPIFGICLGHQLLALATGAKTYKLKYGHRGGNQPVTDLSDGRTYITSQNHGYAVDERSIDSGICAVSHINANDKTCEGLRYTAFPAFTVQFHPEAAGGPHDTGYLFKEFIEMMDAHKRRGT